MSGAKPWQGITGPLVGEFGCCVGVGQGADNVAAAGCWCAGSVCID